MGYYVRAFCTTGETPQLGRVLEFARNLGSTVELEGVEGEPGLDDAVWEQVGVLYKADRSAILLELNRARPEGETTLVSEEIEEFLELLEDAPDNRSRRRVEQHLRDTRFIVAAQLAGDTDDGYDALANLLRYFVDHNGGLIQADGEGFYVDDKLILVLE